MDTYILSTTRPNTHYTLPPSFLKVPKNNINSLLNTNTIQEGALLEDGIRGKEGEKVTPSEEKIETKKRKEETELPPTRIFGKASGIKVNTGYIPPQPLITAKKRDFEEETQQEEQEEWEEYWISPQPELFTKPKSRPPSKKPTVTFLIRNLTFDFFPSLFSFFGS